MNLLKKTVCGLLTASVFTMSGAVLAADDISVILNGNAIEFDVPPQIINSRTMVPLRAIFEALGASVDWNGETRTVTSSKDGKTISLTIDSPVMYVDGGETALDSPACIIDGRTLVPVRAISEAYGTDVSWDGDTRTVVLSTPSSATNPVPAEHTSTSIEVNHEYGPMTVERLYQDDTHWATNKISSFIITSCDKVFDTYKISYKMEGVCDINQADVKIYFYDASDNLLDVQWCAAEVEPDSNYSIEGDIIPSASVVDNTARIEFCSYTNQPAVF